MPLTDSLEEECEREERENLNSLGHAKKHIITLKKAGILSGSLAFLVFGAYLVSNDLILSSKKERMPQSPAQGIVAGLHAGETTNQDKPASSLESLFSFSWQEDNNTFWPNALEIYLNRVYVARSNDISVFDLSGNKLLKFNTRGIKGNPSSGNARDITLHQNRIYVCVGDVLEEVVDKYHVQVFDLEGKFLFGFGKHGSGRTQLGYDPLSITITQGRAYVSDGNNNRIQVFDLQGNHLFGFGVKGEGAGEFNHPTRMDTYNNKIYILDRWNDRVQVFDLNGDYISEFGSEKLGERGHACEDIRINNGLVYIVNRDIIEVFDHEGNYQYMLDPKVKNYSSVSNAIKGIDFEGHTIYLADTINQQVTALRIRE